MAEIIYTIETSLVSDSETQYFHDRRLSSGDRALDKKKVEDIKRQTSSGNPWAWCNVAVRATCASFTATSFWACNCSYGSQENFMQSTLYQGKKKESKVILIETLRMALEEQSELHRQQSCLNEEFARLATASELYKQLASES